MWAKLLKTTNLLFGLKTAGCFPYNNIYTSIFIQCNACKYLIKPVVQSDDKLLIFFFFSTMKKKKKIVKGLVKENTWMLWRLSGL